MLMRRFGRAQLDRTALLLAAAVGLLFLTGCLPGLDPGITLPGRPTGLTATEGTFADRIRLAWNAVAGAEHYHVHRAAEAGGEYEFLAESALTTYEDTTPAPGESYWYRVQACSADGCGPLSAAARGYAGEEPDEPAPSAEFAASQGSYDDRIRVSWQAVHGATSYRLYRADEVTGPFEDPLATVSGTSYDDFDHAGNRLTRCHGYWYRLEVCRGGGCSFLPQGVEGWRGVRIEVGDKVEGVVASDYEHPDRVRLTWDPHPGALSYTIYRGQKTNKIGTSDTASYDDVHDPDENPLQARQYYTYWVRAEGDPDGACEPSDLSASADGRASPFPGRPEDLALSGQEGRVVVQWSAGSSIVPPTAFVVERAGSAGGPYVEIGEVSSAATTYTDEAVSSGSTYWYRVAAVNDWGRGEYCQPLSVSVLGGP